jgi:hypothetical protein
MLYALFATQLYMPYVYSNDCLTTGMVHGCSIVYLAFIKICLYNRTYFNEIT